MQVEVTDFFLLLMPEIACLVLVPTPTPTKLTSPLKSSYTYTTDSCS